jgi:hypothetical protein
MTLANGFATTLMVVACSTAAAQTLVGTPSDATGIDGLVFDGKTYNVTFESGTFQSVFPGGLINGFGRGNDAGLADAMTQFTISGIQGMNCATGCSVLIPYSVVDSAGDTWSTQVQTGEFVLPYVDPTWTVNEFPFGFSGNTNLAPQSLFWWGVVTVPEPSTYGLMVLGLAGAVLTRRRRHIIRPS